jgi:hypothetical protein
MSTLATDRAPYDLPSKSMDKPCCRLHLGLRSILSEKSLELPWTQIPAACIILVLRWGVAARFFRDGQSSRRKDISRLSKEKSKTIASTAMVVFNAFEHGSRK